MRINSFVTSMFAVSLGVSTLAGCSEQKKDDTAQEGPFKPSYGVMAQCQNGKLVVVKKITDGKETSEAKMTTSHEGAQCTQVITLGPGSRYVTVKLANEKNRTYFYSGLRYGNKSSGSNLPLSSGEYTMVLAQIPGSAGDQAADPNKPQDIAALKIFKQMEKAAIGRVSPKQITESGAKEFWPTYSTLSQCQNGIMVHIGSEGELPQKQTAHKADPAASGKPCTTFGSLPKGTLVQVGVLDHNDSLSVSGIYESNGKLLSPSGRGLESGDYLLALVQERDHEGKTPILIDPAIGAAKSFNEHPLIKPLVKAAPPLKNVTKA